VRVGSGGAASCSLVSVARYGLAISGGSAASKMYAEDLVGRALLDFLRHDLGRPAADPLAHPDGRPARQPYRQPGHLRGPGHWVLGHLVHTQHCPA